MASRGIGARKQLLLTAPRVKKPFPEQQIDTRPPTARRAENPHLLVLAIEPKGDAGDADISGREAWRFGFCHHAGFGKV